MRSITELLWCSWRFYFHGRGMQSKDVPTIPSVNHSSRKTPEQIYNSTTWELIQFIRAAVFLCFPPLSLFPDHPLYPLLSIADHNPIIMGLPKVRKNNWQTERDCAELSSNFPALLTFSETVNNEFSWDIRQTGDVGALVLKKMQREVELRDGTEKPHVDLDFFLEHS